MQKNHANKRRKRRNKARKRGRFIRAAIIIVLVLALIGIVLMLSSEETIEETVVLYSMEYSELIRENAQRFGIDPAYAASIVLAESSYDPNAVSSVNAQGLMQIMPDTGKWIAGKFKEEYVDGCLFDPATNIRYGCWYLGFLVDRYDGDLTCSTAAYHSGQGTVDKWLKDPAYSADGKTLSVIAGTNADTYVNRVLKYYEKYTELYNEPSA